MKKICVSVIGKLASVRIIEIINGRREGKTIQQFFLHETDALTCGEIVWHLLNELNCEQESFEVEVDIYGNTKS